MPCFLHPSMLIVALGVLLLVALSGVTHATPLPKYISAVDRIDGVQTPYVSPNRTGCMVRFDETASNFPLSGSKVLLATAVGSDAFGTTTAYQYYSSRGAPIDVYCAQTASSMAIPRVLLETYVPTYIVEPSACLNVTDTPEVQGGQYDVLLVPGGYEAVLALRIDPTFQSLLKGFATSAAGRSRAIFTIDEGAEVLIEASLLNHIAPQGQNKTTIPLASPAMPTAAAAQNATQLIMLANVTQALVSVTAQATTSSAGLHLAMTTTGAVAGLLPLLVDVSRNVLGFDGDLWNGTSGVPLDCNDTDVAIDFTYPTAVFGAVDATSNVAQMWGGFANDNLFVGSTGAGGNSTTYVVDIEDACHNDQGDNTCSGKKYAVMVAHGTHDMQLIGLLKGIEAVGAVAEIYCPDSDEEGRVVYAMPAPSLFPSFAVTCTHYYNESYVVFDDAIFVCGGAIATHRKLRVDRKLILALDQSPSYALYGTALALLDEIHSVSVAGAPVMEVPVVPRCAFTNHDLLNGGFRLSNATTDPFNASALDGVLFYEDETTKQRQRALGGYPNVNNTMSSFVFFARTVVHAQAWNYQLPSTIDRVVGGVFISVVVVVVVAVLAVKLVQRRLRRSASNQYVTVQREEDESSLH